MNKKNHVFISYSTKDSYYVNRIVDALRDNDIPYWIASEHIPAGSSYAREIPKAISSCKVFLLVVSENAQSSLWVEKEVDSAVCNRKNVLPVWIDENPLNDTYRFYLNNVQIIPYRENHSLIWEDMIKRLKEYYNTEVYQSSGEMPEPEVIRNRVEEYRIREQEKRINALKMNKIPVFCKCCGGSMTKTGNGTYTCVSCGMRAYDDVTKVKNYIEKYKTASIIEISYETGVSRSQIEFFIKEGYLEIYK